MLLYLKAFFIMAVYLPSVILFWLILDLIPMFLITSILLNNFPLLYHSPIWHTALGEVVIKKEKCHLVETCYLFQFDHCVVVLEKRTWLIFRLSKAVTHLIFSCLHRILNEFLKIMREAAPKKKKSQKCGVFFQNEQYM